MPELSAEEIARVDQSDHLADILAMPSHLEDAIWRVETAGLDREAAFGDVSGREALLVCGMGGSGAGGDLASHALAERLTRPLYTVRGYELPSWATPASVVLCASYSGNTEETLACYDAAKALGATRIVATTGGQLGDAARADGVPVIGFPAGLQPRASVAYQLVTVLEVAALAGIAPTLRMEIDASAAQLEELGREWGPDAPSDSLAKRIAATIRGACVCVYGARPTVATAQRWKNQLNENAKLPAFAHELPEADHNEIVGWEGAAEVGNFMALFLKDSDQHPRTRQRIELTARLIERVAPTLSIESRGQNPLARLLSHVFLGDLVSVYVAVLRGVDPTPVEVIEQLKTELAGEQVR